MDEIIDVPNEDVVENVEQPKKHKPSFTKLLNDKANAKAKAKKTAKERLADDISSMGNNTIHEEPKIDKRKGPKKGDGRGRPVGSVKEKKENIDIIGQSLNSLLLPTIAKIMKLDINKVLLTPEELKTIASMQPEVDWAKPNWITYSIVTLALCGGHVFMAMGLKRQAEQDAIVAEAKAKKEQDEKAKADNL